MSRTLSSTVLTAIGQYALSLAVAVRFTVNGHTYTKITGTQPCTFDGFTFAADGTLMSIDGLTENRDQASPSQINLANTDATLLADFAANNAASNGSVYLYLVFLNPNGTLLDFVKYGPYLFSNPQAVEDPGKRKLVFEAGHYVAKLQETNGMLFTDNWQQGRHSGDAFWSLTSTLAWTVMTWGGAVATPPTKDDITSIKNGLGRTRPGQRGSYTP